MDDSQSPGDIAHAFLVWMMGNSSPLHLAIIYMDLSLFVCLGFIPRFSISSSVW